MKPKIDISYPSEDSVLLAWPEVICPIQHQQIVAYQSALVKTLTQHAETCVVDSVVSYNTLMIYYAFDKITWPDLTRIIHDEVALLSSSIQSAVSDSPQTGSCPDATKTIEIPVYYGLDAGWDLPAVANQTKLTIDEVIALHSQKTYRAYALGFTPGFCYLGCIDEKIQLPRRQSPRVSVPKGAIAIAEQQTAVYPISSPGGWHIIGQTPLPMYITDVCADGHSSFTPAIAVGQKVRFKAIDYNEFCRLGGQLITEHHLEKNKEIADE